MVGNILQKMQLAKTEFEQGKSVVEILFSSNPGLIRDRIEPIRDRIGDRVQLPERKKIIPRPVAEKIPAITSVALAQRRLRPVAIKQLPPIKKEIRELYRYGY